MKEKTWVRVSFDIRCQPIIANFSNTTFFLEPFYLRLLGMFRTQDSESFAVDLLLRIVVITKQTSEKENGTVVH